MENETLTKKISEYQLVMSKFVHEIRNPLTLVSCELQMLTSNHPEAEDWREVYDLQEHLTYIKNLISEFSDYSNAGRLVIKPADTNLFLSHMADNFRPMFEYLGIRFITDFSPNLPEILADTLRLRQAITNILRNAEESISHDHGEIIFSANVVSLDTQNTVPNHVLHISICDNGCGITPEQFADLGTPFVTHKENGTGLGLTITKQIVESHGGKMNIESISEKGTTVHLYLPLNLNP